ncbi:MULTISPECIES: glycosyltransferase family 2 protein [unclassified Methylobacterium]|uniref:glycosyltransferase family 2 protein n=1 Tax=unclassified Methylobacterium TaxID=2615210 RepID=UPI0036F6078C
MTLALVLLSGLVGLAGVLLAIPVAVLAAEVAAAHRRRARPSPHALPFDRPPLAVVVPAHDEERDLGAALDSIRAQLRPGDRLVVVADNCTDRTAEIAERAGAEVVERRNPFARGKGYAMDAGIRHLQAAPPPLVVFVDADCLVADGAFDALARTVLERRRPAQAVFVSVPFPGTGAALGVARFAYILKNVVRPRGLAALGLPCQLTGSGMAFPWSVIAGARIASSEIVEDLKLGLDCARAGHPPVLCEGARVTSAFPQTARAVVDQRERWQRGHLNQIAAAIPSLLAGLRRRDAALLAQVLDVMVPPLTLLLAANLALTALAAIAALAGASAVPLAMVLTNVAVLGLALVAGWRLARAEDGFTCGPAELVAYFLGNVTLYRRVLARRPLGWVRTDRGGLS